MACLEGEEEIKANFAWGPTSPRGVAKKGHFLTVDQRQGTRVCTVGSGESDVNRVRVCYLVRHLLKGGGIAYKNR